MRILVTGAAGFIGSNLSRALVADGHDVVGLDDLSTGRRANLDGLGVHLVEGDIRDPDACAAACRGAEMVVHLAARNSVPRSLAEPGAAFEVNVVGTQRLFEAAHAAGARRIVFSSSSSVYGDDPVLPRREASPPAPLSPYAATKAAAEVLLRGWGRSFGVSTIGLRFFNVFGPRQNPDSVYAAVVPRFVRAALRGEPAVIHGDGSTSRDFTYVDNVVDAVRAAIAAPAPCDGRAYNVASGKAYSLADLHAAIADATGRAIPPRYESRRPGDQLHSLADLTAARDELGYVPRVGFAEGIARTVAWYAAEGA